MRHNPTPIGEIHWFDIHALQLGLQSLLIMDQADFEQWSNGEQAAEMVDRISRILDSVEARQRHRQAGEQYTCLTPTRLGYCPIHEAGR